jgi:predicted dehydrogenase
MIEAATRAGKTMHVGLTHRFGASHEFYAALFAPQSQSPVDVDLGRPYSYSEVMCSGNPISRWFDNDRLSGGMFVASMYHFIDEARSFFGDPRAIRASYDSTRDGSGRILHDTGHALLSFDGPTVVNIAYSRGFRKPGLGSRRLVVFENGYLEQSAKGSVVRNPDGEKQITVPSDDAMSKDTSHFFETIGRSNETPEWAQASLQIACSLQEDAGLTAGPRRD